MAGFSHYSHRNGQSLSLRVDGSEAISPYSRGLLVRTWDTSSVEPHYPHLNKHRFADTMPRKQVRPRSALHMQVRPEAEASYPTSRPLTAGATTFCSAHPLSKGGFRSKSAARLRGGGFGSQEGNWGSALRRDGILMGEQLVASAHDGDLLASLEAAAAAAPTRGAAGNSRLERGSWLPGRGLPSPRNGSMNTLHGRHKNSRAADKRTPSKCPVQSGGAKEDNTKDNSTRPAEEDAKPLQPGTDNPEPTGDAVATKETSPTRAKVRFAGGATTRNSFSSGRTQKADENSRLTTSLSVQDLRNMLSPQVARQNTMRAHNAPRVCATRAHTHAHAIHPQTSFSMRRKPLLQAGQQVSAHFRVVQRKKGGAGAARFHQYVLAVFVQSGLAKAQQQAARRARLAARARHRRKPKPSPTACGEQRPPVRNSSAQGLRTRLRF